VGHLVNPTGFRLGYIPSWLDTWFSHKETYPEFIHFVIKIRLFLDGLFVTSYKPFSRNAFLFSHFRLTFTLSNIFIHIFFYPAKHLYRLYDRKWLAETMIGALAKNYYWTDKVYNRNNRKQLFIFRYKMQRLFTGYNYKFTPSFPMRVFRPLKTEEKIREIQKKIFL